MTIRDRPDIWDPELANRSEYSVQRGGKILRRFKSKKQAESYRKSHGGKVVRIGRPSRVIF